MEALNKGIRIDLENARVELAFGIPLRREHDRIFLHHILQGNFRRLGYRIQDMDELQVRKRLPNGDHRIFENPVPVHLHLGQEGRSRDRIPHGVQHRCSGRSAAIQTIISTIKPKTAAAQATCCETCPVITKRIDQEVQTGLVRIILPDLLNQIIHHVTQRQFFIKNFRNHDFVHLSTYHCAPLLVWVRNGRVALVW